jgi:hypothetical protein
MMQRRRSYRDVLNDRGIPNEQVVKRETMPHRPPDQRAGVLEESKTP